MDSPRSARLPIWAAALTGLLALALSALARLTLHQSYFLTGWLALCVFLLLAALTPRGEKKPTGALADGAGVLALFLYFAHTGPRLPRGILGIALALLFAALVLLTLLAARPGGGGDASADGGARSRLLNTWRGPLLWALLAVSLVHGVLAHAHGLLSHLSRGEGGP